MTCMPFWMLTGFNEAAGFTRRKPLETLDDAGGAFLASMRPPDLPGGNVT